MLDLESVERLVEKFPSWNLWTAGNSKVRGQQKGSPIKKECVFDWLFPVCVLACYLCPPIPGNCAWPASVSSRVMCHTGMQQQMFKNEGDWWLFSTYTEGLNESESTNCSWHCSNSKYFIKWFSVRIYLTFTLWLLTTTNQINCLLIKWHFISVWLWMFLWKCPFIHSPLFAGFFWVNTCHRLSPLSWNS